MELGENDVAVRCNFCSVDERGMLTDRRAGRISSAESAPLVDALARISVPCAEIIVRPVQDYRFVVVFRGEGLGAEVSDTDPQRVGAMPLEPVARTEESSKTADAARRFIQYARDMLGARDVANMILMRGFAKRPNWQRFGDAYNLAPGAVAAYGKKLVVDGAAHYAFPSPEAMVRATEARFRKMKFSGAKARTLIGLAGAFASGEMDGVLRLPTPGAVERLTRLKGIGRWTAETALLRGAGRLDAFPAEDLGVRKIIAEFYGGGVASARSPKTQGDAARKVAERWGRFAPYAMTYLFHAKRTGRGGG